MLTDSCFFQDAAVGQHDVYDFAPPVRKHVSAPGMMSLTTNVDAQNGPELREGAATVTVTGTHYDGGWLSEGLFGWGVPTMLWVTASGPDEPDAVWHATFEQNHWVDHGASACPAVFILIFPVLRKSSRSLCVFKRKKLKRKLLHS